MVKINRRAFVIGTAAAGGGLALGIPFGALAQSAVTEGQKLAFDRGKGRLIVLSVPRGLGIECQEASCRVVEPHRARSHGKRPTPVRGHRATRTDAGGRCPNR